MRSQPTKPPTKKGALSKTTFKANSPTKQIKKKSVTGKKVKNLVKKTLVKSHKKKVTKDDSSDSSTSVAEFSSGDKTDSSDSTKHGSSKNSPAECAHSSKSNAAESNPKKIPSKTKPPLKKSVIPNKKTKALLKSNTKKNKKQSDDIKQKIKPIIVKKVPLKNSKTKSNVKKVTAQMKKKAENNEEPSSGKDDKDSTENTAASNASGSKESSSSTSCNHLSNDQNISGEMMMNENKHMKSDILTDPLSLPTTSKATKMIPVETPKSEPDRPPKFFTSTRSPRMVDIDVKCSKTSKGNLVVSERFISLKATDTKTEEVKDNITNNLTAQGPDIDVYTFTEKVDSPKSILSEFRNPITKTIGRVRPIARVKGTIIDKIDPEKKKYSPHRPIEEVVKQLKANKRSEELKSIQSQSDDVRSSLDSSVVSDEKDEEENPKPIISKSYKMVARKSSIPGKPYSPIKFLEQDEPAKCKGKSTAATKKTPLKPRAKLQKSSASDDELENSKFSFNTNSNSLHYSSSDESIADSNDDTKESSGSDSNKNKKNKKTKKYKRITDSANKFTSKELKELSKDSLVDLKDESEITGKEKPSKRRLKLMSMWAGPKKHRMASLNAIAKVHCLYENESRTHLELGLMKTVDRTIVQSSVKPSNSKKKEPKLKDNMAEKDDTTSESEYERKDCKEESSEDDSSPPNTRSLRGEPGIRSAGKYWDLRTSSSDDSEQDSKKKTTQEKKKSSKASLLVKSDADKPPGKMKQTTGVPVKKKRNRNEVVMDLKDMVVQKRMASLNATAILAASYEKRSPKSNKDETTSDSCSDESYTQKSKNGAGSGVKSETKNVETKKEIEEPATADRKQKVEVIVNQDTDVTITGVYSTHLHEGFCTVSGMQYRISSTSHTQTTATANCEKEGCSREEGSRYTPLSALSSMQPPEDHATSHNHPGPIDVEEIDGASPPRAAQMPLPITNTVPELGGLVRRAAGCSSAFSAPSPAPHHEPGKPPPASCKCSICVPAATMPPISPFGYYQPAGPLIKESGADAERALARFHPPPHYHSPHPTVLPQYGPPYYPTDLCYARAYYGRPPASYHMPPSAQPEAQMVGVGGEPYPPPQYYSGPPCYQHQHSPQRMPQYIEYRGCPCPMNACPKNVLIGPATGKAPASGGPADVAAAQAPPGGAFRPKVRAACAKDSPESHGSGKDPPLELERPAAGDAPRPCPLPAIGGASPKRELYDARDKLRLLGDMPAAEAAGPPSPARGSAGACAPQPPPIAPRRARLGKDMARRTLAGDDTGSLISAPQPVPGQSDVDDDVLAISPPLCAPIDLSSSDETDRRSTPLVDVKKENEGPMYTPPRKTDAQALKEHNCTAAELTDTTDAAKAAVKRRYSKPKLEIELGEVELEDGCKTNGIGEHVKLQKRRKVSSEQIDLSARTETVTAKKARKKSSPKPKRAPKSPAAENKNLKRKLDMGSEAPQNKKLNVETVVSEDARLTNVAALPTEPTVTKTKNKSALLLDKLLRKNSIDRADFTAEAELNPAELFLAPKDSSQNCTKKTLNINNNVIENNGVRPNTIAAVTQMIGKKAATKALRKVESKVNNTIQSVLESTVTKLDESRPKLPERREISVLELSGEKCLALSDRCDNKPKYVNYSDSVNNKASATTDNVIKTPAKVEQPPISAPAIKKTVVKPPKEIHGGVVSTVEKQPVIQETIKTQAENLQPERVRPKRSKLSIDKVNREHKAKRSEKAIEKVAKLLAPKKSVFKIDEAVELIEDACFSPITVQKTSRAGRRRSVPNKVRRIPASFVIPLTTDDSRAPPRWSNGWQWDGESHISSVYLNNDPRQDRTARCWTRMTHASGDKVSLGDCVLLRATSARAKPFVARVARLWENPEDGEMMVSLVWYYRSEHTELGRQCGEAPEEVLASRHRDANSVACIEDKCHVLTYNEFCRYRKRLKAVEEGVMMKPSVVPPLPEAEVTPAIDTNDSKLPPVIAPELVFYCRRIYDYKNKRILPPNK